MAWPIGPFGEEDAFVRRSEGLFIWQKIDAEESERGIATLW
jgi:hypothetical protein